MARITRGLSKNMKLEFQQESIKAAPAVAGTVYSTVTLNEWVAIATLIYILLQTGYLLWKWHKEYKGHAKNKNSRS